MVSSYRVSTWRIIICTPATSGRLVTNLHQNLAPARGQDQEGKRNKKSNLPKQTNKNLRRKLAHFQWVGGLVGLVLLVTLAVPQRAHAADYSWGNIDLAKKAIDNVAPLVTDNKTESGSASLIFASDEFLQKPLVVETQITKEVPKPVSAPRQKIVRAAATVIRDASSANHAFPYGYCTYYVSQRRDIPWSGNAITWLSGARSYGFATGNEPKVGAIVVTSEGGYTGHVAMVDAVNDDGTITLTEMNYAGWGRISSRTIAASYGRILGYIY